MTEGVNVAKAKVAAVPVQLLSVQDVAELLQVPVGTLYQWRVRGEGPKPFRVGRHLRFDPADLTQWIKLRKSASS